MTTRIPVPNVERADTIQTYFTPLGAKRHVNKINNAFQRGTDSDLAMLGLPEWAFAARVIKTGTLSYAVVAVA